VSQRQLDIAAVAVLREVISVLTRASD
jgi:hypothetical protein